MKNAKFITGIVFVFLLGAASGAFITHMVERAHLEAFIERGPMAREDHIMKRLSAKLDLDSRQREQVRSIVHEVYSATRQVRKQIRPQIETLLERGQTRINTVLKPEQQEKFQKLIAERKAHRQAEGR